MSDEIEFLDYILKNAKMAGESIARLRKERKMQDEIDSAMKMQILEYRKIVNSAKAMIERRGKKVQDLSLLSKFAAYMNIKLNTNIENNEHEIANILIQSSNIGISEMERKVEDFNVKSKSINNLANRLLEIEKNNKQNLMKFL